MCPPNLGLIATIFVTVLNDVSQRALGSCVNALYIASIAVPGEELTGVISVRRSEEEVRDYGRA
jgi:hypothetical protein